jgi:hypothetical protein
MSVAVTTWTQSRALSYGADYQPASGADVERFWEEHRRSQSWSATDWTPLTNGALSIIQRECSIPDWDEAGSAAVLPRTIRYAAMLVECLAAIVPSGTPAPHIVPERDGEISLSWHEDDDHIFSMSVGPHGKVNYAGQFGTEGAEHGWQPIRYDSRWALATSLERIARNIGRVADAAPTRRPA